MSLGIAFCDENARAPSLLSSFFEHELSDYLGLRLRAVGRSRVAGGGVGASGFRLAWRPPRQTAALGRWACGASLAVAGARGPSKWIQHSGETKYI